MAAGVTMKKNTFKKQKAHFSACFFVRPVVTNTFLLPRVRHSKGCLGSWDPPSRPFFAIFICFWSFGVMVSWRQRSNYLAHRWGTLNFEEEETTRPQYHGDYVKCPVTNEWIIQYPPWKRYLKCCIGYLLTFIFTAAALVFMLMAYANRDIILARYFDDSDDEDASIWNFR